MDKEFIKICKISEIREAIGKRFQLDDENEIAIFKINGRYYAVDNICPHNHTSQIYKGIIKDMYVSCPVHGFQFHLQTGKQPEKQGCSLRTFDLRITGDYVYVKKPAEKRYNFHF